MRQSRITDPDSTTAATTVTGPKYLVRMPLELGERPDTSRVVWGPFGSLLHTILRIYGFEGEPAEQGEGFTRTTESNRRRHSYY